MLKSIFFDMDGVLIDSHDSWFKNFNIALKHFENRQITKEEFDKFVWAKNFTETANKYFSIEASMVRKYLDRLYPEFIKNTIVFPGVEQTLLQLKKQKLILAVTTNTHTALAERVLKKLGLLEYFDCVIGGDKVKNGKPEPDMLEKALLDLNLKKPEVLFIGDTIWDKIAAQRAGIKFIGLKIDGDLRIEKFEELKSIL